ncbi:signal peptidase II [Hyphomonas sp. CACIAM 19H1]|uniref:signal peptidase II n=1 Tax=Hyphomonas sp. CACIAM 19H1 TaxID=1873716 RepID=UPI000DEDB812|nr:signal peptidase II [Hyphomonas sp. CACIAM 19H1]AXE65070.1 signal peptidase II [Hyphomonas sp. CACIAM 19H1]
MKLSPQTIWPFAVIPLVVLFDQVTKWLILAEPRLNGLICLHDKTLCGKIAVPGPVDLSMVWNRGMSFGLFQSEGIMRWVMAGLMAAIAIGFFFWLLRAEGCWLKASLALVVGGAIGNLIDRVRFGAVVDFVDVNELTLGYFPWVFNVADAAITIGAILLFVDQFLLSRPKQANSLKQG